MAVKEERLVLTKRMQTIVRACAPVPVAADVGCDHGQVGAALLCGERAGRALFCDKSAPSLEKARRLVAAMGLEERAAFCTGDGLRVLRPGEAQGIVLAGMGAPLMVEILTQGMDVARKAEYLVLSPNIYPERLRAFLCRNGLVIEREVMVEERRFYPVMTVRPGEPQAYAPQELLLGKRGRLAGDMQAYLEYCVRIARRNIGQIEAGGGDSASEREKLQWALAYLEGERWQLH